MFQTVFLVSTLESVILPKEPGGGMTFRNLDLGTRCTHCCWDITASRLSVD